MDSAADAVVVVAVRENIFAAVELGKVAVVVVVVAAAVVVVIVAAFLVVAAVAIVAVAAAATVAGFFAARFLSLSVVAARLECAADST